MGQNSHFTDLLNVEGTGKSVESGSLRMQVTQMRTFTLLQALSISTLTLLTEDIMTKVSEPPPEVGLQDMRVGFGEANSTILCNYEVQSTQWPCVLGNTL